MAPHPVTADIAILGGGPAGAATALALKAHAPELRVLLIERSRVKRRIGETLPPGVEPVLEKLGVWDSFRQEGHLRAYGTRSTWGGGELVEQSFMMAARGDGWHLDRRRFDDFLLDQARQSGAEICMPGRVLAARRTQDGWSLRIGRAKTESTADVRFVVDATGRSAWFARRYGGAAATATDSLVGAFQFFHPGTESTVASTLTLTEPVESGYWYAAVVPAGGLAVALMTDVDLLPGVQLGGVDLQDESKPSVDRGAVDREALKQPSVDLDAAWCKGLEATDHGSRLVAGLTPVGPVNVTSADARLLDPVGDDSWLAVGDAASTFDPLSSLGIFKALRSGLFAAYTIADRLAGDAEALNRYRAFVSGGFDNYLQTHRKYYLEEQRWPDAPFWLRRHATIKLDPATWLVAAPGRSAPAGHLTPLETSRVRQLCQTPRQAHQILTMLRSLDGLKTSDHRRILGLQYLVTTGALVRRESPRFPGI